MFRKGRMIFVGASFTFLLRYAFGDCDRHYRLDYIRASRDRYRLGQIREMENARQTGARTGSDGPRAPGKIAQSHEAGPRYGSAARINAAVSHKLTLPSIELSC